MNKLNEIQQEIVKLKQELATQKDQILQFQLRIHARKTNLNPKNVIPKTPQLLRSIDKSNSMTILQETIKANENKSKHVKRVIIDNLTFAPFMNHTKLKLISVINPETKKPLTDINLFPTTIKYRGRNYLKTPIGNYTIEDKSLINEKTGIDDCLYYTINGVCGKEFCPFAHYNSHISLCPALLRFKGQRNCNKRNCSNSHTPNEFNSPSCVYFNKDNCKNPHCIFTHKFDKNATSICRTFAHTGYCEDGMKCPFKHSFDCPHYYETGVCKPSSGLCNFTHTSTFHKLNQISNNKNGYNE